MQLINFYADQKILIKPKFR